MKKPLDNEQFNYMLSFAIRALNSVYYEDIGTGRVPIQELRLKIKNKIKRLKSFEK